MEAFDSVGVMAEWQSPAGDSEQSQSIGVESDSSYSSQQASYDVQITTEPYIPSIRMHSDTSDITYSNRHELKVIL